MIDKIGFWRFPEGSKRWACDLMDASLSCKAFSCRYANIGQLAALLLYILHLSGRPVEISRDMTNQQSECAPSEDSDQPGHPPSLIRVFDVRMKKSWVLSYPLSAQLSP